MGWYAMAHANISDCGSEVFGENANPTIISAQSVGPLLRTPGN